MPWSVSLLTEETCVRVLIITVRSWCGNDRMCRLWREVSYFVTDRILLVLHWDFYKCS
jgi:hypothetical protein